MKNDETSKNGLKSKSNAVKFLIPIISYVLIWGIMYTLWITGGDIAGVIIIICAIFGWLSLNRIQPSMFLWLSWGGWFAYIINKFVLSALIGLFVTPWYISKLINKLINK